MGEKRKRVLMMSHGVTGQTGFAKQLYLQSRALIESGYEVFIVHRNYIGEPIYFPKGCGVELQGGRKLDDFTMLPVGRDQWGTDILPYYIMKYKPDYVHTLGDIWCYQFLRNIPKHHKWSWLAHYVFDTENMVGIWNESVNAADISVVPSKNAHNLLTKQGHENAFYVPHGINTDIFTPATHEEKVEFRKSLGIPEKAFVIGMVAHNQQRKMVNRLIDAFTMFAQQVPDAMLVLHCQPKDATGWDLPVILKDRKMSHRVLFTDKASKGFGDNMVTDSELRKLYCALDVHALPTGGEGFGIPIVEAMACGIPNVVTAYTTTLEFLSDDFIDGERWTNDRGIPVEYNDVEEHQTGGNWAKIDRGLMAKAFKYLYDNRGEAKTMGQKARKFAVDNYSEEVVKNAWQELYSNFDDISDALDDKKRETLTQLRTTRV